MHCCNIEEPWIRWEVICAFAGDGREMVQKQGNHVTKQRPIPLFRSPSPPTGKMREIPSQCTSTKNNLGKTATRRQRQR